MNIADITRELSERVIVFPGDRAPAFTTLDCGAYRITEMHMSSHNGTHIDAPAHFIKDGLTIDRIPLHFLIGPARVIDLGHITGPIEPHHVKEYISGAKRILLKTSYSSQDTFSSNYSYLTPETADLFVSEGIFCVGADTPSIEMFEGDGSVHRTLLGTPCVIIELLDLSSVEENDYFMIALPLRLKDMDGSPARVILIDVGDGPDGGILNELS